MNSQDSNWLRPLRELEGLYHEFQKRNFMIVCYDVIFHTSIKLDEHIMRKTLQHLYEKVICLRLCIREHQDGNAWFFENQNMDFDFKILPTDSDLENEFQYVTSQPFDSLSGPLWRVRLQNSRELSSPANLPHENRMLFCYHHAIADGFTMLRLLGLFMNILNCVIRGEDVSPTPFGFLSSGEETEAILNERNSYLEENPEVFQKIQETFKKRSDSPALWQNLKNNETESSNPKSYKIFSTLEEIETKSFIKKMKSLGVSFNSGFMGMAYFALREILVESGFDPSIITIPSYSLINCRRYWKQPLEKAFGVNTSGIIYESIVPDDNIENIESFIKEFHNDFKYKLDNKIGFDEEIVHHGEIAGGSLEDLFNNIPPADFYFSCSNRCDVTSAIDNEAGCQDQAQLYNFASSTSIHGLHFTSTFNIQTYRGKLTISLDYNTRYLSKSTAQQFLDKTIRYFKFMSSTQM